MRGRAEGRLGGKKMKRERERENARKNEGVIKYGRMGEMGREAECICAQ